MKTPSLLQVAFLVALLGTGMTSTHAQTPSTPPAATAGLTLPEKLELKKDRDQVLAANPDLKAEGEAIDKQRAALKSQNVAKDSADWQALTEKSHAHQQKVKDAILKLDPDAAPILAKVDAAHKAKAAAGQ